MMAPHIIRTQWQLHVENLRHAALGVVLGMSVMLLTMPSADLVRINRLFVEVGHHICRDYGGLIAITGLTSRRFRFVCQGEIVIEQDVVLR